MLVRSLSSTSNTRSAPRATRLASRSRPAASISSIPGVSISSIWLNSGTVIGQGTACWRRVQPWAMSVASTGFPTSALIRLDLPTPTRPKTAMRSRRCSSRSSCRSSSCRSPLSAPCSRALRCRSERQRFSSCRHRSVLAGGDACKRAMVVMLPACATSPQAPQAPTQRRSRRQNLQIRPPPRELHCCPSGSR